MVASLQDLLTAARCKLSAVLLVLLIGFAVDINQNAVFVVDARALFVDCENGSDSLGDGTSAASAFRTLLKARDVIRSMRQNEEKRRPKQPQNGQRSGNSNSMYTQKITHTTNVRNVHTPQHTVVKIAGLCELKEPLTLDSSSGDSDVTWQGVAGTGAILSGGTRLNVTAAATTTTNVTAVNLSAYNITLGTLRARGYAGGSACILVNNYERSAAELFYRPPPFSSSGTGATTTSAYDPRASMRLARYPNMQLTQKQEQHKQQQQQQQHATNTAATSTTSPSLSDWLRVARVASASSSVALSDVDSARLETWSNELKAGGQAFAHGLWRWNWADSHRPIRAVTPENASISVGQDDINRDVPLSSHGSQGGNLYVYNLRAELDQAGEYYIDRGGSSMLYFLPPLAALPPPPPPRHNCTWRLAITRSDQPTGHVWETINITGAASNETFSFKGCSATWGPMGRHCAGELHVASGSNTLVNSVGKIVGEGVCCNGVRNSIASTTLVGCRDDDPLPPQGRQTRTTDIPPPASPAPPSPPVARGDYHVSRLDNIIVARGVSNVNFTGLEIRYARGGGIIVLDSENVVIDGCIVADHGMMGVNVTGGVGCGVQHSEVAGNGDAGVVLEGGDRTTLTPAGHFVHNSSLHRNQRWIMNYAPNVLLAGVGQRVTDSEIHHSPQIGVFFQGNNHTMTDTKLHDLAQQCSDCGAFYMGRDWTYRGNMLLRNSWSRISSIFGGGVHAVYLDDQLSSVKVAYNTFSGVGSPMLLGGGRNNEFIGNILNATGSVIEMDDRGGSGTSCCGAGKMPYIFLNRVPYSTSSVWVRQYPDLSKILTDQPCLPKYNVFNDNVLCGGTRSMGLDPTRLAAWGSSAANNTIQARC